MYTLKLIEADLSAGIRPAVKQEKQQFPVAFTLVAGTRLELVTFGL